MDRKKLSFDIGADQIDIKPILKKDFLELKIKAISTANPNRNNSWFTKQSMVDSKDTFKNKPILGYFENGDFVSHNGEWKKDPDTGMDYWDTLGQKGERILGVIRSEDDVEIVDDNKGLSWLCCSCALWTQYSYKQVKRLLQDAKRAKKTGESAKNISVEVEITDYESLENGVIKINKFNLIGITILGSRNGVKVEPGIEDAELSVVDIMGKDLYERQMQGLRLAYERLDGSDINKEEFSNVILDEVQNENAVENIANENTENTLNADSNTENAENVDGTTLVEQHAENHEEHFESTTENTSESNDNSNGESTNESFSDNSSNDSESDGENGEGSENADTDNDNPPAEGDGDNPVAQMCGDENRDPICDISWLIGDASWNIERYQNAIDYYESHDVNGKDYILPVLHRLQAQERANEAELAGLLAKLAEGYTADEVAYEEQLAEHCDCKELYKENCELHAKCEQLEATNTTLEATNKENAEKLSAYAHEEFLKKADKLLKSAKVDGELYDKFYAECEKGEINSVEDLKTKVALNMFDSTIKVEETATLDTPIIPVDPKAAFSGKAEKSTRSNSPWANVEEYTNK